MSAGPCRRRGRLPEGRDPAGSLTSHSAEPGVWPRAASVLVPQAKKEEDKEAGVGVFGGRGRQGMGAFEGPG